MLAAIPKLEPLIAIKCEFLPTSRRVTHFVVCSEEDNIELFKDLEDFAVNMEQISSPDTTFALLMDKLLISQLSDLEKVGFHLGNIISS